MSANLKALNATLLDRLRQANARIAALEAAVACSSSKKQVSSEPSTPVRAVSECSATIAPAVVAQSKPATKSADSAAPACASSTGWSPMSDSTDTPASPDLPSLRRQAAGNNISGLPTCSSVSSTSMSTSKIRRSDNSAAEPKETQGFLQLCVLALRTFLSRLWTALRVIWSGPSAVGETQPLVRSCSSSV